MSNICDRQMIDAMALEENGTLVLIIFDHLQWDCAIRYRHASMLQDKINDYLEFIGSDEIDEHYSKDQYQRIVIRIIAKNSYSQYCIEFLKRVQTFIRENVSQCDLEWTHLQSEGDTEVQYNDGFSDEYVFDIDKIYPRIKKNWSKKPLQEVTLMASEGNINSNGEGRDSYENTPMFRVMDSYVILLMQDVGSTYAYLTYDNIPDGMDISGIQKKAFDNLLRDKTYRIEESKISGIYGILCGGDFEAESLCCLGIWADVSENLKDDLLIAVPTKDLVFLTRASDKKLVKKMMKLAREAFERNQKESPYLLFSKDVFLYSRSDKKIVISNKYMI